MTHAPDVGENTSWLMPATRAVPAAAGSTRATRPRRRVMVPPPVARVK